MNVNLYGVIGFIVVPAILIMYTLFSIGISIAKFLQKRRHAARNQNKV